MNVDFIPDTQTSGTANSNITITSVSKQKRQRKPWVYKEKHDHLKMQHDNLKMHYKAMKRIAAVGWIAFAIAFIAITVITIIYYKEVSGI